MTRTILVAVAMTLLGPYGASAQVQTNDANGRVAWQLGQFYIQLQQQQDQIAGLRAALEKEQAEVKRLKDKHEPEPTKSKK